jgi:hypothetical protein
VTKVDFRVYSRSLYTNRCLCVYFTRGWNYVECIESIIFEDSFETGSCWTLKSFCRDVLCKSNAFEMTEFQRKSQTLTLTRVFIVHVIVPDVMADNGIFHGIDGVILPNSFTPCHTASPQEAIASSGSTLSHFAAMVAVSATLLLAL